jgi:hypothetical protein
MNANLQKYLKYKSKYLDLKNELEGGGRTDELWKKFRNQLKNSNNLQAFKTLKKEDKLETHNKKILPFQADKYKLLIDEKISSILIRKQELIIDTYKNYSHSDLVFKKIKQFKNMFEEEKENIETMIEKYNEIADILNKYKDKDDLKRDTSQQFVGGKRKNIDIETYKQELDFDIDDTIVELMREMSKIRTLETRDEKKRMEEVKLTELKMEEFKLTELKKKKSEILEKLTKNEKILEKLHKNESERTTKVATNDSGDNPSKRNKGVSEDPPSDDDDKGNDFDCEELKRNIDKLCAYYKNMKDANRITKDKIKEVFKSVNDLTKNTNKLQNEDKYLTEYELTSLSEDNKKTLNKDKLPDTISHFHNQIDNEKDLERKRNLIKKFSAMSDDIKLYYNRT